MKDNKLNVMNAAHILTRKTIATYDGTEKVSYSATFAVCLRYVYRVVKLETVTPETVQNLSAEAEFRAMTDTEQYNRMYACAVKMYKYDLAETDRDGNERRLCYDWIAHYNIPFENAMQSVVSEMYTRVWDYFSNEKYDDTPLSMILCKCALRSADSIKRHEFGKPNAISTDDKGVEYIESALVKADKIAPNPESAVMLIDTLESCCFDLKDEIIVKGYAIGLNQSTIAKAVGISQQAISKRLSAFEKRYSVDI